MQVNIVCPNVNPDPIFLEEVHEVFVRSLGRFAADGGEVRIILKDENGPRGGVDKACVVRIRMAGLKEMILRDWDDDPRRLVYRLADRAGNAIGREHGRKVYL